MLNNISFEEIHFKKQPSSFFVAVNLNYRNLPAIPLLMITMSDLTQAELQELI